MFRANKKTLIKTASLISVLGLLLFLGYQKIKEPSLIASAKVGDPTHLPLRGYLWSDTIGWIKLRHEVLSGGVIDENHSYGVTVNPDNGQFSDNSWAWSDNVGWIAFYDIQVCSKNLSTVCTSNADCSGGSCVNISTLTPNNNYQTIAGCTALACYKENTKKLYGWAYVLSMGKDGWIKLDNNNSSYAYGINIANYNATTDTPESLYPTWGDLKGYAWGGGSVDNTGNSNYYTGLGWVSFGCTTDGTCGSTNQKFYQATGRPYKPKLFYARATDGADGRSVTLKWTEAPGATYYEVYRYNKICDNASAEAYRGRVCDNSNQCSGGACVQQPASHIKKVGTNVYVTLLGITNTRYIDGPPTADALPLQVNRTYTYHIRACNIFGCSLSNELKAVTSPIDDITEFRISPICNTVDANMSYIDLSWKKPYVDDVNGETVALEGYELERCLLSANMTATDCDNNKLWKAITSVPSNVNLSCRTTDANMQDGTSATKTCRDLIPAADTGNYHLYRLRAISQTTATLPPKMCIGGDKDGSLCDSNADCCFPKVCQDGDNKGQACTYDNDCINSFLSNPCTDNDCSGVSCAQTPYSSNWVYTRQVRVCNRSNQYQEVRPK